MVIKKEKSNTLKINRVSSDKTKKPVIKKIDKPAEKQKDEIIEAIDLKPQEVVKIETTQPGLPEGEHGKIFASWQFSEFPQYQRGLFWYGGMGILTLGLLIYCLIVQNFLLALIIVLVLFIFFVARRRNDGEIDFQVTEDGLQIGDDFHNWREIDNFYIIYEPPDIKSLYISFKASLRQDLKIPLLDNNPLMVRKVLLEYLQEDLTKEEEPAIDFWTRFFKL
ncbi:MAG: hypothetical protein PHS07_03640 [Patescibacteria group bacterium]|nr:hypothetical protein [Patescibacteria group bacterium]